MLEAIRTSLDGLTEQEQKHYKEKDGKFYLDVGPVDGLALEDVTGLKRSLENSQREKRDAEAKLKKLQTDVGDMDLAQAKEALAKYDEIKTFDANGKVKAAIEARTRELVTQHNKELAAVTAERDTANSQLDDLIVVGDVVAALQTEKGNVELLKPHVMQFIKVKIGADGKRYPEVVDKDGTPRVGDGAGNPMTILQRVQEMKKEDTYASAFEGANSTGSGTAGSGDGKSGDSSRDVIPVTQGNQIIVNDLEKVASGETKIAS
jgi:hypothetical protein